jgi:adenylylsulfate kinase
MPICKKYLWLVLQILWLHLKLLLMIYFFTGQPHSGKTTLANHLKKVLTLRNQVKLIYMVDGDDLRRIINNKDYSEAGRRANIGQAIAIAKYLDDKNYDVIVSLVSPYKDLREELKASSDVIEIYVHTTDVRGRESFHVADYQPPTENFIDIDTTGVDELTSLNELLNKIQKLL